MRWWRRRVLRIHRGRMGFVAIVERTICAVDRVIKFVRVLVVLVVAFAGGALAMGALTQLLIHLF